MNTKYGDTIVWLWYITGFLIVLYGLGLILLRRGLRLLPSRVTFSAEPLPPVTIVVSLHNEAANVEGLLTALLAQKYPRKKLQFILVNDRSSDETGALLQQWAQRDSRIQIITITHVPENFAPKKYAIFHAVQQAQGEIILQTDADGRPTPQWVQEMVSYFAPEVGVVLGYAPYRTTPPFNSVLFRLLALEYCSIAAIAMATTGFQMPATAVGTNLAYRKEAFMAIQGYGKFSHIPSGDDDLFVQEIRKRTHWRFAYASSPQSVVWNNPPTSFRQFYFQRLRFASKGLLYPKSLIVVLTGFYFMNLLLLSTPVIAAFAGLSLLPWIGFMALKMIAEGIFLFPVCRCFHQTFLLPLVPLASLLHIPYVLYFGAAAQFKEYQWKDVHGKGSFNYFSSS